MIKLRGRVLIDDEGTFLLLRCEDAQSLLKHIGEDIEEADEWQVSFASERQEWHDVAIDWLKENGQDRLIELLPGDLNRVNVQDKDLEALGRPGESGASEESGDQDESGESDDDDSDYNGDD